MISLASMFSTSRKSSSKTFLQSVTSKKCDVLPLMAEAERSSLLISQGSWVAFCRVVRVRSRLKKPSSSMSW